MHKSENLLPFDLKGFHIHFVGIKGTGMAALVELAHFRGAVISGSDVSDVFYTDAILARLGIPVLPFDSKNITDKTELVIHSSAYKRDTNPDLIEATSRGIPILLYTEALGAISALSYSCGISGVHGKTSTTALTGSVLKALDFPTQVLVGSVVSNFNDSCTLTNGKAFFVAETCEYQRHFMSFHPKKIVLTSVESDHEDYYPTFTDIQNAFVDYALLLPPNGELIFCADDKGATETASIIAKKRPDITLTPYGESASGSYKLTFGAVRDGKQFFRVACFPGELCIRVPGKHMVRNAVSSVALCVSLINEAKTLSRSFDFGASCTDTGEACNFFSDEAKSEICKVALIDAQSDDFFNSVKQGLLSFSGAKRRSEIVGEVNGCIIMDDYAHHPTAIKTTLAGIRDFYPNRRIIVDFMSHTYTRTAALLEDFASAFDSADEIILHKIYPSAREQYDGTVTGKTLYEKAQQRYKNVHYFEEVLDALPFAKGFLQENTVFITMGAGDNWKLGKALLDT